MVWGLGFPVYSSPPADFWILWDCFEDVACRVVRGPSVHGDGVKLTWGVRYPWPILYIIVIIRIPKNHRSFQNVTPYDSFFFFMTSVSISCSIFPI